MTLRIEAIDNDTGDTYELPAGIAVNVTADSGERDGNVYLCVNVTHEAIIVDTYDEDGNCAGTICDDFDGWARRVEDDPAQKPLWDNDLVQFARLLDEIRATQDGLDYRPLRESMDLDDDGITEIFERAMQVFETSKAALPPSPYLLNQLGEHHP